MGGNSPIGGGLDGARQSLSRMQNMMSRVDTNGPMMGANGGPDMNGPAPDGFGQMNGGNGMNGGMQQDPMAMMGQLQSLVSQLGSMLGMPDPSAAGQQPGAADPSAAAATDPNAAAAGAPPQDQNSQMMQMMMAMLPMIMGNGGGDGST